MTEAIVCDVGRTIITTSVLNHMLKRLGQTSSARVLYDMEVLAGATPEQIDAWVDSVVREKLSAMLAPLSRSCRH